MLSARQLLLLRRARDRAINIAIAPFGTVVFLPDPDFRRRVFRCFSHVGLSCVARWLAEWIVWITNNAQRLGAYLNVRLGSTASISPVRGMSGLPLIAGRRADMPAPPLGARSGCEQLQQGSPLFDHLVGEREQRRRHLEA